MKFFSKSQLMIACLSLLVGSAALAEVYRTYVSPQGQKLHLTFAMGNLVLDEVTLDGEPQAHVEVIAQDTEGNLEIKSGGRTLLSIKAQTQRSGWKHRQAGWFNNGDSRQLQGELIFNGEPVSNLTEIYASE